MIGQLEATPPDSRFGRVRARRHVAGRHSPDRQYELLGGPAAARPDRAGDRLRRRERRRAVHRRTTSTTSASVPATRSWIEYDADSRPAAATRPTASASATTASTRRSAPFDDPHVRLAFAKAVDWERMSDARREHVPATSIVPPGIPGRDDDDHRPTYDPDAARALLERAGFPDGEGFPPVVTLATYGVGYEDTVVAQELEAEPGCRRERRGATTSRRTLEIVADTSAPPIWTLRWSADYPHAHDFLGLLLETGSSQQHGPLEQRRLRRADRAGGGHRRSGRAGSALRTGPGHPRGEAPVVPRRVRRVVGAESRRACWAPSSRASGSFATPASRGRRGRPMS